MEKGYVLQLQTPNFKELYLAFCGWADCMPLHSYGPASRPHYILHYILDGCGTYWVGGQKYRLSKGEGFLIEPETMTFYQADRETPWTYLWVGLGGTGAGALLREVGLLDGLLTYRCGDGEALKALVFSMLRHPHPDLSERFLLQGLLYEFFSVLTRGLVVESPKAPRRENLYVERAAAYIRSHFARGVRVEELAAFLNVNRSYLYTLFKETLGLSPKEFLRSFQISRAREELLLTDLSVEEVAAACGFSSGLTFSRAFKQMTGMTPSAFRRAGGATQAQNVFSPDAPPMQKT